MGYVRTLIEDPDHPDRLIDTKDGSIVNRSNVVRRFEDSFDYNGRRRSWKLGIMVNLLILTL